MEKRDQVVLNILKASVWGKKSDNIIGYEIFDEMQNQAVFTLSAPILSMIEMPEELRQTWKNAIIRQLCFDEQNRFIQSTLPITVPYLILKGTAAAQYYPYPEYRATGDIDLITKREDYQSACEMLLADGYIETSSHPEDKWERHRIFSKNNVTVEIHSYFAMLNDPQKAEYLDNLIIQNINPTHVLPDQINGLVILEHINQHLEKGLGLRQIIDWMMFVDKCLPDDKWPEFCSYAKNIGLERLALVITKMCMNYLDLPRRKWCADADDMLCEQLMEYILSCGNFGNKKTDESDIGQNILAYARSPKSFCMLLQQRGLINWKEAQKHPIFRPFAWLYQIGRYLLKGFGRSEAISKLRNEYELAKKRNELLNLLGVRQVSKGAVVFKKGRYIKK